MPKNQDRGKTTDLSIIVPQLRDEADLQRLLSLLPRALARLPQAVRSELIVAQPSGRDKAIESALAQVGGVYIPDAGPYGKALRQALALSKGGYVLTMESDLDHNLFIIPELYARRHEADLLVASRYMRNGYANYRPLRRMASRLANGALSSGLDLPVRDVTSGFRIYRRRIFDNVRFTGDGYGALVELLVLSHAAGFEIRELPFHYFPSERGFNEVFARFGSQALHDLYRFWRLRNSIECADYDERALRSRVWLQRSWQQRRYHAIMDMARPFDRILDVGCGSSQILDGLPQADGCDIRLNKLRHKRGRSRGLVRASVFDLPFRAQAYDCVIFSQVIEHLPRDPRILEQLLRVVKPGGYLIVGTPDYATWWPTIEKIYGFVHPTGYADEHITHYTFDSLRAEVEALGCTYIRHAYVWKAELIMMFRVK